MLPLKEEQHQTHSDVRRISVLGSTGSIGRNTLDVIQGHRDSFLVEALTAQTNVDLLAKQARQTGARLAVIGDENLYSALKVQLSGSGIETAAGTAAIIEAASRPVDCVMSAIVGSAGIAPTMVAVQNSSSVAIANKESVVCAGSLLFKAATKNGTLILPVDSEHNAIFQIFDAAQTDKIEKVYITASGGPFLRKTREELSQVTPEMALKHPTWSMGAKISIDSATMVNKTLEIIESSYLFNLKPEKIEALIHPQSLIHALVEYSDGSILSHMGPPDMRTAITHVLGWPNRIKTTGQKMNFDLNINLSFEKIDNERFIAIDIAYACLKEGSAACAAFSCANEVAVDAFLKRRLAFDRIEEVSLKVISKTPKSDLNTIEDVFECDRIARGLAQEVVQRLQ